MTLPLLQILTYSFMLWFGLYLLGRDWHKAGLRYAGLGLISYALALALSLIVQEQAISIAWRYLPILLPSVFWMGAILYLVPDVPIRPINRHLILAMIVLVIITFGVALIQPGWTRFFGLCLPVIFLVGVVLRLFQIVSDDVPRPPVVVLITATIFFALATALIALPIDFITHDWVVLAISLDLICLGYSVGVLDAYDEGTSLFTDALRSFASASLLVFIIGGQIMMVMVITDDSSAPMLLLLLGVITTLLVALIFSDNIQRILDQLILSRDDMRQQRADLRAVSSGITRATAPLTPIDEQEFIRWTRRALSHYGDLNKLASSPLLQLPLIDEDTDDNVLARANALKSLLREGIEQLKPDADIDFAPSDEWRYYNVLYFPYIVGIKPYSSRFYRDDLSPAEQEALDWFRTYVPERTLYNWQKTAAELVAQHLREQLPS